MTAYCNRCGKSKNNDRIRLVTDKTLSKAGKFQCIDCILKAVSKRAT